jgi:hypothetical protein
MNAVSIQLALSKKRRGRIYFAAHNKNHVEIFDRSYELITSAGVSARWVAVDGFAPSASEVLKRRGLEYLTLEQMRANAQFGDMLIVGNDWLPAELCDTIDRFKQSGIRTVAVIEGCRFTLPNKYTRVDELLGWGPSARTLPRKSIHVVGSPTLENTLSHAPYRPEGKLTLVNYRFKSIGTERNSGSEWLGHIIEACAAAGSNIVISAHPASGLVDPRYKVSADPVDGLLGRSSLLVSRCSTIIYQALVLGIPSILLPTEDEEFGEFAEPMDAFPIAKDATELAALVGAHYRGESKYDPSAFLARHVSIDPVRSAATRIADVLLALLK